MSNAIVNIVDVEPKARKLPARMITEGALLFDVYGGTHPVRRAQLTVKGKMRVTREDGWFDTWDPKELITFIPAPANDPQVGDGATEHLFADKLPYVVVRVSKTGHKVTLAPLKDVNLTTGHKPAGDHNGFPVWDHTYTAEELTTLRYDDGRTIDAFRQVDGRYKSARSRITFDGARYFRNYAD